MRTPAGFTLIETLVALVLFTLAMLALATAAAVAAGEMGSARRLSEASGFARDRVATLAAVPCPAIGSGTIRQGAAVEQWRVEADGRARRITDSVVVRAPNGRAVVALARVTVLCS